MPNVTVIFPGPRGEQAVLKFSRVPSKDEFVSIKNVIFQVVVVIHHPQIENRNHDAVIKLGEIPQ
jgi:hypothetical protein